MLQGFLGEEALMTGDQDVRKGQKASKHVIRNGFERAVIKEKTRFFFVHISPERTDLTRFDRLNDRLRIDQAASNWYLSASHLSSSSRLWNH